MTTKIYALRVDDDTYYLVPTRPLGSTYAGDTRWSTTDLEPAPCWHCKGTGVVSVAEVNAKSS